MLPKNHYKCELDSLPNLLRYGAPRSGAKNERDKYVDVIILVENNWIKRGLTGIFEMIGQNAPTISPKQVNFAFVFKKVGQQKKSEKSMLD